MWRQKRYIYKTIQSSVYFSKTVKVKVEVNQSYKTDTKFGRYVLTLLLSTERTRFPRPQKRFMMRHHQYFLQDKGLCIVINTKDTSLNM